MNNVTTITFTQDDIDTGLYFINATIGNRVVNIGSVWVYDDSVVMTLELDGEKIEITFPVDTFNAVVRTACVTRIVREARHLGRALIKAATSRHRLPWSRHPQVQQITGNHYITGFNASFAYTAQ